MWRQQRRHEAEMVGCDRLPGAEPRKMTRRCGKAVAFAVGVVAVLATFVVPKVASAFCGFYVSGSQQELYNNATRVAMMRGGQRTVLTMQNNYEGPPEDFAMVVPVPQVLDKEAVKTVEDAVFKRLKKLTAPRLVEYWQQDPCPEPRRGRYRERAALGAQPSSADRAAVGSMKKKEPKVTVESKFSAGEYDIVVLSSNESTALDTWLRNHNYNIPDGAATYFRPYIQQGMYFFVAKVDVSKVEFDGDRAMLSPLRFHYESKDFKLPVRLGLINSKGKQDLIAYLLADEQRYRVANYPNVTIPTNLPVKEKVKQGFAQFYDSLFSRVIDQNPGAVVTEYSWTATSCDPCPVQPLQPGHLMTLGANIIRGDGASPGISRCDAHRPESNGWLAVDKDAVDRVDGMEAGRVDGGAGDGVTQVMFDEQFEGEPLVFAQSQTTNNTKGALSMRVRRSGSSSAELQLCHQVGPDACDNKSSEQLAWLAVDSTKAADTEGIDWGTVDADGSWQDVTFGESFGSAPIVIATVQSAQDDVAGMYAEVRRSDESSVQVRACRSNGGDTCVSDATARVAWLAVERGALKLRGERLGEAGYVNGLGDAAWSRGAFEASFESQPLVFATTQTQRGRQDPSAAHLKLVDNSGFATQHCEWDYEEREVRNIVNRRRMSRGWTVTRLHARYDDETLGEDLVFEAAPPIRGGRGMPQGKQGRMTQQTPSEARRNNFQARYVVRHRWDGEVTCDNPRWNRWGGRGRGAVSTAGSNADGSGGKNAPSMKLSQAIEQSSVPGIDGSLDGEAAESPAESTESDGGIDEPASDEEPESKESSSRDEDGAASGDPSDLDDMIEDDQTETPADELYKGGDARRKPSHRPWKGLGVLAVVLIVLTGTTSVLAARRERRGSR